MREEEARKKTCPYMLISFKLGIISLAGIPGMDPATYEASLDKSLKLHPEKCQASNCMMWKSRSGDIGGCGLKMS